MRSSLTAVTLCLLALTATGFPFERKPSPKEKRVQYAAWTT